LVFFVACGLVMRFSTAFGLTTVFLTGMTND
jgi:hypothetical protein